MPPGRDVRPCSRRSRPAAVNLAVKEGVLAVVLESGAPRVTNLAVVPPQVALIPFDALELALVQTRDAHLLLQTRLELALEVNPVAAVADCVGPATRAVPVIDQAKVVEVKLRDGASEDNRHCVFVDGGLTSEL